MGGGAIERKMWRIGLGSFGALLLLFSLSRRRRRCLVPVCDHSQSRVAWRGGAKVPRLKKVRRPPPLGRGDKRETEKRVLYVQARDGFGVTEWGGLPTATKPFPLLSLHVCHV